MTGETSGRFTARASIILVVVCFLLSTTVSLVSLHLMDQHNTREMNKVLTTQINDYIKSELSGPITAARTMANNSYLIRSLADEEQLGEDIFAEQIVQYLSRVEDGLGYNSSFVISDATKRYYTRSGFNRVIDPAQSEQDAWYAAFKESGLPYDLDVDSNETNPNDLMVYVNARIEDNRGTFLGMCGVGVHMTGMQELFRSFEEGFGVKISLVAPNGIVQVDTNTDNIESLDLSSVIEGKKSGEYVYDESSSDNFTITKYIDDLDWYLVVQSTGARESGRFFNIILLNVIICLVVLAVLFIALRTNVRHANRLRSVSLLDHPTGLSNKRAFAQDKARLEKNPLDPDFVCVTVDVNGLKTVNDTLGHNAGDELIRGAAECMKACFDPYGKTYRIGGDEFAAFLTVPEDKLEGLKSQLTRTVSEWKGETVLSLAVSCGYASAREHPTASIAELNKISDERMYEDKEAYYERMGFERRRT